MAKRGRVPTEAAVHPKRLKAERTGCMISGRFMDQADAGFLIGVSRITWCRWETGRAGMAQHYYDAWTVASEPYRMFDVLEGGELRWRASAVPAAALGRLGPIPSDPLALPDASELEAPFLIQEAGVAD